MSRAATLELTEAAAVLGLARAAIRAHLGIGGAPPMPTSGALAQPRGAFVTLRRAGALRGCVGTFVPPGSLAETVVRMAVAAAAEDPRFPPVAADEVDDLDLHVSVLDPVRRMREVSELQVGRDGVLVRLGWHRGALLPGVAAEEGWDAETFLERTCLKAGLPPDSWKDPAAVVELFSTEELG